MLRTAETPSLEGLPARPHHPGPTPSRRGRVRWTPHRTLEHAGVVMAIVVFMCAGTSFALQVPPFHGTDERAHLGYAHAVADGRLPEIEDRPHIPADAARWREEVRDAKNDRYRTIWVANHPPLHYLLVAPLTRLATATGRADGGLLLLRFANLAFASIGIVFTYLLTVPGDRRLAAPGARRGRLRRRTATRPLRVLPGPERRARLRRRDRRRVGGVLVSFGTGTPLLVSLSSPPRPPWRRALRAAAMIIAVTVVGVLTMARFWNGSGPRRRESAPPS